MYENMTMLSNKEYAELVIKANKYDLLRERTVNSTFATSDEVVIFELTVEELNDMEERRKQ